MARLLFTLSSRPTPHLGSKERPVRATEVAATRARSRPSATRAYPINRAGSTYKCLRGRYLWLDMDSPMSNGFACNPCCHPPIPANAADPLANTAKCSMASSGSCVRALLGGAWQAQQDQQGNIVWVDCSVDGSSVRAHQHAAGARRLKKGTQSRQTAIFLHVASRSSRSRRSGTRT